MSLFFHPPSNIDWLREKSFIASSFTLYSNSIYEWVKIACALGGDTAEPFRLPHHDFQTVTGVIWAVQDSQSQQEWPRCFTDDSKKEWKDDSHCLSAKPSTACQHTMGVQAEWWRHCSTLWSSKPQKEGEGIKKALPFLFPMVLRYVSVKEKEGESAWKRFLAPLCEWIHLVKFESWTWKWNMTSRNVSYEQQPELMNRLYCKSRKSERLWSPGSIARNQS